MADQTKTPDNFKHIVRIANVDVSGKKAIKVSLTKIKGIGKNLADIACKLAGVDRNAQTGMLPPDQVQKLTDVITNLPTKVPAWLLNRKKDYETGKDTHILTGTLNFVKDNDLKRLQKIKSNRGIRHGKKLTVRGQRTRSNFRHNKGKVIGVKKKSK